MSVSPVGQQTSLVSILQSIQTLVMNATQFPVERVSIVAGWPDTEKVGMQDVLIRPGPFTVLREQGTHGSGRLNLEYLRQILVRVRNIYAVDTGTSLAQWLQDPVFGSIPLEEIVTDAIHGKLLFDSTNKQLIPSPILLQSGEMFEADEAALGFGSMILTFLVRYLPPINVTVI